MALKNNWIWLMYNKQKMLCCFKRANLFIKSWDAHHCNFSACQGQQECCFFFLFFWQRKNPLTVFYCRVPAPCFRYDNRKNFQNTAVVHEIRFQQKGTLFSCDVSPFKACVTWKVLNNKCCQRTYVALICCGPHKAGMDGLWEWV